MSVVLSSDLWSPPHWRCVELVGGVLDGTHTSLKFVVIFSQAPLPCVGFNFLHIGVEPGNEAI